MLLIVCLLNKVIGDSMKVIVCEFFGLFEEF